MAVMSARNRSSALGDRIAYARTHTRGDFVDHGAQQTGLPAEVVADQCGLHASALRHLAQGDARHATLCQEVPGGLQQGLATLSGLGSNRAAGPTPRVGRH
jgi:hypothetical protein